MTSVVLQIPVLGSLLFVCDIHLNDLNVSIDKLVRKFADVTKIAGRLSQTVRKVYSGIWISYRNGWKNGKWSLIQASARSNIRGKYTIDGMALPGLVVGQI